MGLGMRMATDMVAATLIGVAMGYYLDQWLATRPWLTILFFFFGAISGFRMMYRIANEKPPEVS
ncbi:MAG: AtpZ/AtpI family protein [Magnetococcales bacterium]|nr:AtpZ/AtpI family protein [Magnetococcales bacterium]